MKKAHAVRNAARVRSKSANPMNTGNRTAVNRPVPSRPFTSAINTDSITHVVSPAPIVRQAYAANASEQGTSAAYQMPSSLRVGSNSRKQSPTLLHESSEAEKKYR